MKNLPKWNASEAQIFLQAMNSVGSLDANGSPEAIMLEFIKSVQSHVLHSDIDIQCLESITPAACAALIKDEDKRFQLIQILILMPYVDMSLNLQMIDMVDEYANAFGLNPNTLRDLHKVKDNHLKRLLWDYGRRSMDEFLGLNSAPKLVKGFVDAIHQSVGDPILASKYKGLVNYPEGSLGHSIFYWYRDREWPLPGEHKSMSELLIKHDCCHILGGFNTDTYGEMNVAAFQAGLFSDGFGFESLLEVILDFHLGKKFSTVGDIIPPSTGSFVPDDAMAGYEKGLCCNVNIIQDLDFWSVANVQVSAIRENLGIPRIDGPILIKP